MKHAADKTDKPTKVAIIGGGASGMITAYLLDKQGFDVSVFEGQAMLGGNIRTITQNVLLDNHSDQAILEGGVIEFSEGFEQFRKLLQELDVPYEKVEVGTGLFLENGQKILSPYMHDQNTSGLKKIIGKARYLTLQLPGLALLRKIAKLQPADVSNESLATVLASDKLYASWARNFMMYSYSIDYKSIDEFPAELALLNLKNYMRAGWFRIIGGVYSYIDTILQRFAGQVFLNARVDAVTRKEQSIEVRLADKSVHLFDKIVFATPPDQVLNILSDASSGEQQWFSGWQQNTAETIIHTDASMYKKYHVTAASEFDFFETRTGWGYNALLNNVCGLGMQVPYYLSYNLEHLIDPETIIHRMSHNTPGYSVTAMRHRNKIIKENGVNGTYYVGAWLGDGLHEGAVQSAQRAAELFASMEM